MSSVIAVLAAVYGGSIILGSGAGLLSIWSPRFRQSLIGDQTAI